MRFTIVLALCFIGVVSAGSLNKRSFLDDLQNNTQNAFHAFEQFGQNFNEKVQEALKNLFNAFGNKTNNSEVSVIVSKRQTNPLQLINDLGDPAKLAQDLLKVLAQMATGQGKRKREIFDDLKKFSEEAKHNAEEALKKLFSLFEQLKNKPSESSDAVNVIKRQTNPLQLINDIGDPAKFAQDLLQVLAQMATGQGKRKRDAAEELKKFAEAAKQNAQEGLKKLFEFLEQFKNQFAHDEKDAEKVVSKRDIQETLENFNKLAQTKAQEAFKNIQKALEDLFKSSPFFQSVSSQSNNGENSIEKPISKRGIFDTVEKFSRNAFDDFMNALDKLFNRFGGDDDEEYDEIIVEPETEHY
uniref:Secreted protein 28 n=1 Tax=Tetranychus evansi TaxID=178897 RepID=A0A142BYI4_9ACAR|nr:secreted protein 28 [Tetranychus evansi]